MYSNFNMNTFNKTKSCPCPPNMGVPVVFPLQVNCRKPPTVINKETNVFNYKPTYIFGDDDQDCNSQEHCFTPPNDDCDDNDSNDDCDDNNSNDNCDDNNSNDNCDDNDSNDDCDESIECKPQNDCSRTIVSSRVAPQKGLDMYGGYKLQGGYGTHGRHTSNFHVHDDDDFLANHINKIYNVNSLITNINVPKNTPDPNYTPILPTRGLSLDNKKDMISTNFRYSMFGRISGPYAGCASCPK